MALGCIGAIFALIGPYFSSNVQSAWDATAPPVSYNMYFGDLHTHTAYSDAWEGTPWDAFAAGEEAGADFMATTDHVYLLSPNEWTDTMLAAKFYTSDTFVAMAGYEYWTMAGHEYWHTGSGEINVFNTTNLPPEVNDHAKHANPATLASRGVGSHASRGGDLPTFYDWLAGQSGAVGQWNHPTYITRNFLDFAYLTENHDKAMGIIEVWNWKYTESSYIMALDKGWHVMPSANSDTHSPDWISGSEVRTVLLAPSLTPDDLYGAMSAGRGYATLDRNLHVSYTLNGAILGSVLSPSATTYVASIHIEDPDGVPSDDITLVEIVSDGGIVVASIPTSGTTVDLTITLNSVSAHYFYLRVSTASELLSMSYNHLAGDRSGVTAWTAPVWTGR